jgi:hypothetical protein
MRFLTLYTPADPDKRTPQSGAKMGAFVQDAVKSGVLVATGGVIPSIMTGTRLAAGKLHVETAPFASDSRKAGGWAILDVKSPEHLEQVTRQFLEVAGDGVVEVMEITQVPMS